MRFRSTAVASVLLSAAMMLAGMLAGCDLFVSPQKRVERAEQHIAARDYRAAMIELKSALQSQSDHARARLLLAEVSLALGDADAAEKELRRAQQAGVPAAQTAPAAAEIRLALGRAEELLIALDSDELQLPEPQRSTYRGRALFQLRRPQEALTAFQAAIAADPNVREAHLGLADVYAALGRTDEALKELNALIERDPQAADAWLARGVLHTRMGRLEDAHSALQTARQHAKRLTVRQQAALFAALTETQLALRNLKGARESHKALAELTQDAPLTRLLAGRIEMADQNYQAAAAELQRVVTAAPDFVQGRFLLGAVLLAQGNLRQAELHLTQVVQQAPENLEARKLLAQVQLNLQRPDAALQALSSSAVPTDTANADGRFDALLGLAHLQRGEQTKGLELLRRSVAQNPQDRGLKLELASALLRSADAAGAAQVLRDVQHAAGDVRRERLLIEATASSRGTAAAAEEVERLVSQYPNEADVLNLAGAFHARQGDYARARALLDRAERAAPADVTTLVNRGRLETAAGDLQAGARWLERALEADPKNLNARLALADLAMRRNDVPTALKLLEEARRADANAAEPRLRLAKIHLRERRTKEADELFGEVLKTTDGSADVVNAIGLMNLEAGRYDEAVARFRAATELSSDEPRYWLNLARAQLSLGHGLAAREALQKALERRPDWVPAVSALALLDVSEQKTSAALTRIAAAKKASPQDAAVFIAEGDVHMALRQYPDALAAFDRASQLQPSALAAMKSHHARRLGKLGDPSSPLEAWLKVDPRDFVVRGALAESYRMAGQADRALQQYELIVRESPLDAGALNNLAWMYHERGDARAEQTARRAYSVAPQAPAIADTYGWVLVAAGKSAEGLPILKEAAAKAPTEPDIQYHYAAALAATGSARQARDLLTGLLGKSPNFASRKEAEQLLERLSKS